MKPLKFTQTHLRLARISLISFFCFLVYYSNAQNFITEISLSNANLNSTELQTYQTLTQDTFTESISLVSVGNPRDFINNEGIMKFTMPRFGDTIEATIIDITQTDNSFGWIGNISKYEGVVAIHVIDGFLGSWIQIDGQFFELMPINSQVSSFRKIAGDVGELFDCPVSNSSQLLANYCDEDYNTCDAQIDILVLYPPDVTAYLATRYGVIPQLIPIFINLGTYHSLQAAFARSDIPNKRVSIKNEAFNFQYTTPYAFNTGLTSLTTQAENRRTATGADLVILITTVNYPGGAGAAVGVAQVGTTPAHAIVEIPWLINPRWTFAHEVGHLLGGRHIRPEDNHSDCGHGWTIGDNRFQRTIMGPWFGDMTPTDIRVLHFSNPDVNYNESATGTSTSDNAKTIRNAACAVSTYRTSTTFGARPIVPPAVFYDCGHTLGTFANVQQPTFGNPGVAPYTYEWRWNTSGDFDNDPSTLFGTTAFGTLDIPNEQTIWVRLRVISSDNLTVYAFRRVWIFPCQPAPFQSGPSENISLGVLRPIIYPNPALDEIQVVIESVENNFADVYIYDQLGSEVYSIQKNGIVEGINKLKINVSSLPGGWYTLSVRTDTGMEYKSLGFVISR